MLSVLQFINVIDPSTGSGVPITFGKNGYFVPADITNLRGEITDHTQKSDNR
jgi:hypothetical protein